jgi:hypothetical protein
LATRDLSISLGTFNIKITALLMMPLGLLSPPKRMSLKN